MPFLKGVFYSLVVALLAFSAPSASAFPGLFDSYPANVNGLTLDRTVLRGKDRSRLVKVWTLAADPENDQLVFNFTVSGGKILQAQLYPGKEHQTFAVSEALLEESGYSVIWDLSGVQPGEYTITAGVDDGCGLCGQTRTQTVIVDPVSDVRVSPCPTEFEVVQSHAYRFKRNTLRFLAVPSAGQLYETLPPPRWTFPSNAIVSGNGSPLVDIVSNRKQDWIEGSFVREPNYMSAGCDFSDEFKVEFRKIVRR